MKSFSKKLEIYQAFKLSSNHTKPNQGNQKIFEEFYFFTFSKITKHTYSQFSIWSRSFPRLSRQMRRLRQVMEQVLVYLNTSSFTGHVCLRACVSEFLFLWCFLYIPLGKKQVFVVLMVFALVEQEQMKCEVILPWNEMRGEITVFYFLLKSVYIFGKLRKLNW